MRATPPPDLKLKVASPCSADWESMSGTERVRFCALCRKNVYNLSQMSLDEAHELLAEKEGRVCVRFFQRADGTVLTEDCPVGLGALRRRARAVVRRVAGAGLTLLGLGAAWTSRPTMGHMAKPSALASPAPEELIMGKVAVPAPPEPTPSRPHAKMGAVVRNPAAK